MTPFLRAAFAAALIATPAYAHHGWSGQEEKISDMTGTVVQGVSLAGPLSNIPAVILTGLIVPLGFLTLVSTFLWARLSLILAQALGFLAGRAAPGCPDRSDQMTGT